MCYFVDLELDFVDLELDLEVTFQGQKEKILILSSGHLSFARKTSGNVRKKHYQPPRRLRTQSVEEFIDSATPSSEIFLGTFKRARINQHGGDFGRNFGAW